MASNRLKEDDMAKPRKSGWLFLLMLMAVISAPGALHAASPAKPAIVLAAFGTTTEAFDTYGHFEQKVRERFPGYEIRWAFTSRKVRHKLAQEKGKGLNDLATTLRELKAAGFTRWICQHQFYIGPLVFKNRELIVNLPPDFGACSHRWETHEWQIRDVIGKGHIGCNAEWTQLGDVRSPGLYPFHLFRDRY